MLKFIVLSALVWVNGPVSVWAASGEINNREISRVKSQIVATARRYQGQGDPDFAIQNKLQPLVDRLLRLAPQKPVRERLPLLAGAWKQVWGPYDYRNNNRGVDPELGVNEIYQVVSIDGYYHNVSPQYARGDRSDERIGLLRGEYTLSQSDANSLEARFTRFTRLEERPSPPALWKLPALSERGILQNEVTLLPDFLVRLLFGGGTLIEVYTDRDLRLLYGVSTNFSRPYLYVMTRVR